MVSSLLRRHQGNDLLWNNKRFYIDQWYRQLLRDSAGDILITKRVEIAQNLTDSSTGTCRQQQRLIQSGIIDNTRTQQDLANESSAHPQRLSYFSGLCHFHLHRIIRVNIGYKIYFGPNSP